MIIMLVLFTLPAAGILLLQNEKVQTRLTRYVASEISGILGTKIEVGNVAVTFINRLQINKLYLEDQHGDTLLYANKVKVTLRDLSLKKKDVSIRKLLLDDADIHLITDSTDVVNLKFIVDYIKKPGKSEHEKWDIGFDRIELSNSRFRYSKDSIHEHQEGIDFLAMDLRDLFLRLDDFTISGDTVSYHINNLQFTEVSGFRLENMNARMSLSQRHMDFENVYFHTPYSNVSANHVKFSFTDYEDFSDYVHRVDNKFNFRSSLVDFRDVGYFAPALMNYDEKVKVSGLVTGTIADMHGDNILLSYNDHTRLQGSFYMIGLPDFRQTFMHYSIEEFSTNTADIRMLTLPDGRNVSLPPEVDKLGTIGYKGKFTGYIDDFVAFGNFDTDLGKLSSDILIKPGRNSGLKYRGKVETRSFRIGYFTEKEDLAGAVSMALNVDGFTSPDSLSAVITGKIDSVEINDYIYKNIDLNGELVNKTFDGSFNISDPNIQMNFLGEVDFSEDLPRFHFTADVARLRPYYLNLGKSVDPSYFASFLLQTNFTGKNLDELNGEINLINSYFERSGENIQIFDFRLMANNSPDSGKIRIRSDVMDFDLSGSYRFSTLAGSFKKLSDHYVPALFNDSISGDFSKQADANHFDYHIQLKNIEPVVHFFFPDYKLGNNSYFSGHYNPSAYQFTLLGESPYFEFFGNQWEELKISAKVDSSGSELKALSKALTMKNKLALDNLSLTSLAYHDTILMNLNWNSYEYPKYEGRLNILADLRENPVSKNPVFNLKMIPSQIVFNDTVWKVSESRIVIDSSSVKVDSFTISNQNQLFLVDGEISTNPEESLRFRLNELDLSTLNIFTKKMRMEFMGNITGQLSLKNPFQNPVLLSDLYMKGLHINGERFGEGQLKAVYNDSEKKIHMIARANKETSEVFLMEGDYFPATTEMNFDITFDKLRLNSFYPYTEELISDLKGLGSGRLSLEGELNKPQLNGEISLFKTSFVVDYLQTRYYFSNKVRIINNRFLFNDFEVFDSGGNRAVANGMITNRYLRDFVLDFTLETPQFTFLNTTEKDNELFFGNIFAGGIINITGPPENLMMEINAKTGRNTVFYIPLYGTEVANENDFITFVNQQSQIPEEEEKTDRYDVEMEGLTMDFNLEITPDAEVQLIFDPKIGDILKGKGNGNLKLGINSYGKFEIYGDITIEQGDYLFTLQNVINKKFEVKPGGRISWNGDPDDANIDLKAIYPLRTSVYNLAVGYNYDPSSTELESLKKRIPVECQITMTGKLMEPNIKPDIELPTADQQTKNIVQNSISTEEDMMIQFLSLLVINNFISTQGINDPVSGTRNTAYAAGIATTTELLSNQLNRWLSQISNDIDIGFNYRPGDEISSDEVELALSTQILNDRVTLNGNVDVGGTQQTPATVQNTNNIVGDFDVDIKITENGKFHVKAFNRSNDNLLIYTSPYTQGVGVMYREDFNSVNELMSRYKDAVLRLFTSEDRKKMKRKTAEKQD